jgi:hypothetical protein
MSSKSQIGKQGQVAAKPLNTNIGNATAAAPSTGNAAATGKSAVNSAKNAVSNAATNAKEGFKKLMAERGPIIILLIAVLLVFVIVIIYIVFALKNSNLSGKVLTSKPIKLDETSVPVQIASSDIPKPAVGREYTYSFWLYVDTFEQSTDNNKLLFYRGGKDSISTANPVVMMDGLQNKLYFAIKTQDSTLTTTSDLRTIVTNNYFKNQHATATTQNKHIIMEIDYVPLQRWVNIICVVDNKIVSLFMDGEIYSVKTVDELKALRKPELNSDGSTVNYNLLVDKTDGDIFIGKNTINNKVTVNGYMSKLEFNNYAINLNQIKGIYNMGPLSGGGISGGIGKMFGAMGLDYSVRSPIYKTNENI